MKKKENWIFNKELCCLLVLVCCLYVEGCSGISSPTSAGNESVSSITKAITNDPESTSEIIQPVSTKTTTVTENSLPISVIKRKCLPINKSPDMSDVLSGTLITNSKYSFIMQGLEILKVSLPFTENDDYITSAFNNHVSPDRQKLIYNILYQDKNTEIVVETKLVIFHQDNSAIIVTDNHKTEQLINWFDNDWLLYNPMEPDSWILNLVNPLTGETREIATDFPELYYSPPMSPWYGIRNPIPVFDPSGSLAVYLRGSDEIQYALWDIENKKLLWTRDTKTTLNAPQWSLQGEKFALGVPPLKSDNFELYSVSRTGTETQLTNFSATYKSIKIGSYSWSPDGGHIAFWIGNTAENGIRWEIAIMDIAQSEITNYCLGEGVTNPIWSPDGRYLAVGLFDKKLSLPSIAVIDTLQERAILIDEKAVPIGWML